MRSLIPAHCHMMSYFRHATPAVFSFNSNRPAQISTAPSTCHEACMPPWHAVPRSAVLCRRQHPVAVDGAVRGLLAAVARALLGGVLLLGGLDGRSRAAVGVVQLHHPPRLLPRPRDGPPRAPCRHHPGAGRAPLLAPRRRRPVHWCAHVDPWTRKPGICRVPPLPELLRESERYIKGQTNSLIESMRWKELLNGNRTHKRLLGDVGGRVFAVCGVRTAIAGCTGCGDELRPQHRCQNCCPVELARPASGIVLRCRESQGWRFNLSVATSAHANACVAYSVHTAAAVVSYTAHTAT